MKKYVLLILLLSGITHFAYFGYPNSLVFDEVYFGNFATAYTTGNYFFDIHPPLGKLIISAAGYLGGFDGSTMNYEHIGNTFTSSHYIWYRFLPTVAGFLLPLIIFFLCLELGLSRKSAFFAALLIIFENSLLVQSRFILLDSFLLLFGFSSLLAYAWARKRPNVDRKYWVYLSLSAVLAVLAFSIKWTGVSFLGLIIVMEIVRLYRKRIQPIVFWRTLIAYAGISLIIYASIFYIHFKLLPHPGPGDPFMNRDFQTESFPQKFVELNIRMFTANAGLTSKHQYGSPWYSWPFMSRGVYYWTSEPSQPTGTTAMIYLLGNPFVYWFSSIGMFTLILSIIWRRRKNNPFFSRELLIVGAYLMNLLPFAGISRVAFLYHYETALVIAIIALAYIIDTYSHGKHQNFLIYGISALCVFAFFYFAPISYGMPMPEADLLTRFWLPTWR